MEDKSPITVNSTGIYQLEFASTRLDGSVSRLALEAVIYLDSLVKRTCLKCRRNQHNISSSAVMFEFLRARQCVAGAGWYPRTDPLPLQSLPYTVLSQVEVRDIVVFHEGALAGSAMSSFSLKLES
jgi:hypothetical protein